MNQPDVTEEEFDRIQQRRAAFIALERAGVLARREQADGSALVVQLREADNAIELFDLELFGWGSDPYPEIPESNYQSTFSKETNLELDEDDNLIVQDHLRDEKEIRAAEEECFDRLWYLRDSNGGRSPSMNPEVAKRLEEKYGKDSLNISDTEWIRLEGRLMALRWALGSEWDFCDT